MSGEPDPSRPAEEDRIRLRELGEGWRDEVTATREPGSWWKWAVAVVAIVTVAGMVGARFGSPTDEVPDGGEVAAPSTTTTTTDPIDPGIGAAEGDDSEDLDQALALPASVTPPELPDGLLLVGHTAALNMVAIDATGSVVELLPGDAQRFIPTSVAGFQLAGTLTFTGEWLLVEPGSSPVRARPGDGEGPEFWPGATADPWVVHGRRSGALFGLGLDGEIIPPVVTVPLDARVLGVLDRGVRGGVVITSADGRARVLDLVDGSVVDTLPGRVLIARGSSYVAVECSGVEVCVVRAVGIASGSTVDLPVASEGIDRSLVGMSTGGAVVALRDGGRVQFVSTDTGARIATYDGRALGGVSWTGDRAALVWEGDGTMTIVDVVSGSISDLDVGGLVDPRIRGAWLVATR